MTSPVRGRKVWGTETLSAPELQGYLQDQVVMQFTSASDRDAQLPAPTDGTTCYLADVDLFCSRVNGAWVLWRPNINAGTVGTTGVALAGSIPPAGQPLMLKVITGNVTSSSFGDNTLQFPGGAFPNGVVAVIGQVNASLHYNWNPWNVTLSNCAVRLNNGTGAQVSTTILSSFLIIGW